MVLRGKRHNIRHWWRCSFWNAYPSLWILPSSAAKAIYKMKWTNGSLLVTNWQISYDGIIVMIVKTKDKIVAVKYKKNW